MKTGMNTVKLVAAFVVIVGVIVWAVTATSTQAYSGVNLTFPVQGGPVSLTNPSDQVVPVLLASSGTRSFRVTSSMEGVSGSSTREGTGNTATQSFIFDLVPGASEVTVTSGTNVVFTATTESELQAIVSPMSQDAQRFTLIAAAVIVLGALFYASSVTKHGWIKALRLTISPNQAEQPKPVEPTPPVSDGGQGREVHSYGDNRAQQ